MSGSDAAAGACPAKAAPDHIAPDRSAAAHQPVNSLRMSPPYLMSMPGAGLEPAGSGAVGADAEGGSGSPTASRMAAISCC